MTLQTFQLGHSRHIRLIKTWRKFQRHLIISHSDSRLVLRMVTRNLSATRETATYYTATAESGIKRKLKRLSLMLVQHHIVNTRFENYNNCKKFKELRIRRNSISWSYW